MLKAKNEVDAFTARLIKALPVRFAKTPNQPASKMRNKITIVDGIRFDSKHEANVYLSYKLALASKSIVNFVRQVKYVITINDIKICTYIADFVVYNKDGTVEVVDAKSVFTSKDRVYRLKKKLLKAVYNIDIIEV
jgi:hypothetical protein